MIRRHALAMTTGGNDSTFAFFLLGVPAPLPFFESLPPPVLDECMSGGGGGGPGRGRVRDASACGANRDACI